MVGFYRYLSINMNIQVLPGRAGKNIYIVIGGRSSLRRASEQAADEGGDIWTCEAY